MTGQVPPPPTEEDILDLFTEFALLIQVIHKHKPHSAAKILGSALVQSKQCAEAIQKKRGRA